MNADLFFDEVEFFAAPSGQKIGVKMGTHFRVRFNDAPEGAVLATAGNDPVLSVTEGLIVAVSADKVGFSEIQLQLERAVVFYISVEVFDKEAVSLNPTASEPEFKWLPGTGPNKDLTVEP
jgi:hypothetical protein